MGSCQNYGPFLGTLNNRCRIIIGTQKGTLILTTTYVCVWLGVMCLLFCLKGERMESGVWDQAVCASGFRGLGGSGVQGQSRV